MYKELRIKIPTKLYKEYRVICMKLDLSVTKQTQQMLRTFVETQEWNLEAMKNITEKKDE